MNERRVRSAPRPIYGRPQPTRGVRRRVWRPRLGLLPRRLLLLAAAVIVVIFILRQAFAITSVKVISNLRSPEITQEVHASLGSWQQSNLLTMDAGTLESALQRLDPMIKSISVQRSWPHGVSVSVILKQPSLGWSSGNQTYLLDRDGTVISALPAGSTLPVVVDGSNLPVKLGDRVTSSRFVDFTTSVTNGLPALGVKATTLAVKETTFDLYVNTNKGYQLVFDTTRPVAQQLADLKTILVSLAAQKRTAVEYIDLRIDGKAYYK